MSFKCQKCGEQRDQREKQTPKVLEYREVKYTNFSNGIMVESTGTEIVREIKVGECCK
jgi:hypothetical protein